MPGKKNSVDRSFHFISFFTRSCLVICLFRDVFKLGPSAVSSNALLVQESTLRSSSIHARNTGHPIVVHPVNQDPTGNLINGERVEEAETYAESCVRSNNPICIQVQARQSLRTSRHISDEWSFFNHWSRSRRVHRALPYYPARPPNTLRMLPIEAPGIGNLGMWHVEWNAADDPAFVSINVQIQPSVLQLTWSSRTGHQGMQLVSLAVNWALVFTDVPDQILQPAHNSQYGEGHAPQNTRFGLWVFEAGPITELGRVDGTTFQRTLTYPRLVLAAGRTPNTGPIRHGVRRYINPGMRQLVFTFTVAVIEEPEEGYSPHRDGPRTHSPP